jgi:heme/copper-type cytochrome/quinol oxidase subunit 4
MKKFISYGVLAFLPAFALAADLSGINSLVVQVGRIIALLIPIMFALAIVYFFWGLVVFLRAAGDPKAQEAGRNQMIWGVIAIAVMVSVYGLVNWLRSTLGIGGETSIPLPSVPGL